MMRTMEYFKMRSSKRHRRPKTEETVDLQNRTLVSCRLSQRSVVCLVQVIGYSGNNRKTKKLPFASFSYNSATH